MLGRAGTWGQLITQTAATLGAKSVRTTRFVSIGSGTSGTVTLPSNATVILDDFGGTVDAVVTQISGGKPTQIPALTSTGVVVATTFNGSGNWAFSGTPVSYPVAIVYRVSQTLTNFDSNSSDIWGGTEFHDVLAAADGGTGQSSYASGDILYSSATNVLSKLAKSADGTTLTLSSGIPAWITPQVIASSSFSVTDGQSATNLSGETYDGVSYTSIWFIFEIIRGTTVMAVGQFSIQYKNSTWILVLNGSSGDVHGVTFSVSQTTTVAQIKAALTSGPGNGTIKFKKMYFAA